MANDQPLVNMSLAHKMAAAKLLGQLEDIVLANRGARLRDVEKTAVTFREQAQSVRRWLTRSEDD